MARALGSAPTIPIGAKVRLLGPIRPRIRASEWNRRRVSSVSSASPEGRDKVAGGNAPGKRSSLPGPTLQGSQRGGTRVKLGRSPPVRATPSGSVGFPGGLPRALPPATIRCPCRAQDLAPRRWPTLTRLCRPQRGWSPDHVDYTHPIAFEAVRELQAAGWRRAQLCVFLIKCNGPGSNWRP